jgi:hypothetical protein
MTFNRWIPTFLAFPIGGYVAIETVGSSDGPLPAALGGLIVGAAIGVAQWLALRSGGTSRRWIGRTTAGVAAGAALAAVVTGSGTEVGDLVLSGLVTGAVVGAVRGPLLGRGARATAGWAAVTSGTWALGWLITSQVIVDAERGFHMFGSSGALVATLLSGLALRALTAGPAPAPARPAAA